ncbi:MAG TPA: Asp23/Gls24 family envelope stress response protein [Candidatus Limnocylindrales bacterium]
MTERRVPGRSIVTRHAIVDIVRPAVSGSYGVLGFADRSRRARLGRLFGIGPRGIEVSLRDGIAIDLHLTVAYGLPVAEVARQADSAVRYALRRALGREVARLTVHVGGLRFLPLPETPHLRPIEPTGGGAASSDGLAPVASETPIEADAQQRPSTRRSSP